MLSRVCQPNHTLQRTTAGRRLQSVRLVATVAELGSLDSSDVDLHFVLDSSRACITALCCSWERER
jgi:hypothetical protein